jgi:hypothetical protein
MSCEVDRHYPQSCVSTVHNNPFGWFIFWCWVVSSQAWADQGLRCMLYETLCISLELSLYKAVSSVVLYPVNFSCSDLPGLRSSLQLGFSPRCCSGLHSVLQSGDSPKAGTDESLICCFWTLWDRSVSLPYTQSLVSNIFVLFWGEGRFRQEDFMWSDSVYMLLLTHCWDCKTQSSLLSPSPYLISFLTMFWWPPCFPLNSAT